ncbi:hypothetical protein COU80_03265 [Candidatus Peregrinibacteria bacterium CG10_big_fil_rev_8_21_14_0_10_55_24]|nr:MAG: hypothetical protein COU80_03265 [Candidatus Peregrinibacteria bacterium CG10_big_fil_rev_8_21_14_0_10_55_24]
MENSHNPRLVSRNTFGEALIVALVVVGFFVAFLQNKVALEDVWTLAGFLTLIVIFYMALLFCRMLFFWMTGGDQTPYPWWKHVEMQKKYEQKSK